MSLYVSVSIYLHTYNLFNAFVSWLLWGRFLVTTNRQLLSFDWFSGPVVSDHWCYLSYPIALPLSSCFHIMKALITCRVSSDLICIANAAASVRLRPGLPSNLWQLKLKVCVHILQRLPWKQTTRVLFVTEEFCEVSAFFPPKLEKNPLQTVHYWEHQLNGWQCKSLGLHVNKGHLVRKLVFVSQGCSGWKMIMQMRNQLELLQLFILLAVLPPAALFTLPASILIKLRSDFSMLYN